MGGWEKGGELGTEGEEGALAEGTANAKAMASEGACPQEH